MLLLLALVHVAIEDAIYGWRKFDKNY